MDTRLLRNPILLASTPDTNPKNYKNDPNVVPIHFDTRQLQETFQQQQPFKFPDFSSSSNQQTQQQHFIKYHHPQNYDDSNQSRMYSGTTSLEKRKGGFKKEINPVRQPRYTPKIAHLRPSPQIFQRKVLLAKLV